MADPVLEAMREQVAVGPWNAILPRAIPELLGAPGIRTLELREPSVAWATGLITLARDPASPMVAALREEARSLRALSGKDE